MERWQPAAEVRIEGFADRPPGSVRLRTSRRAAILPIWLSLPRKFYGAGAEGGVPRLVFGRVPMPLRRGCQCWAGRVFLLRRVSCSLAAFLGLRFVSALSQYPGAAKTVRVGRPVRWTISPSMDAVAAWRSAEWFPKSFPASTS